MKKVLLIIICISLILCGCSVRVDKTTAFKKYTDTRKAAEINELCRSFFEETGVCGMSVGIMDGFEVKFFNYGKTDINGAAVSEDTVYQLGTLTEMFTGVLWAEWENRGWFMPETQTSVYFPYTKLPTYNGDGFNSFNLVTHTSGLPELPENFTDFNTYDDLLLRQYLISSKLASKPGVERSHSYIGMGLLGYLLESRLKSDYETSVKNSIMYRCSMTSTFVTPTEEQEPLFALPHDESGRALDLLKPYSCLQGSVGFNSTVYDMLIFASLNLAKVDVSTFLERAVSSAHENKGFDSGYGFYIDGDRYYNSNLLCGSSGYFGVDGKAETAVCILCNTEKDVTPLAEQIFEILNS